MLNQKDLAILIATNKNNLSSIVKRLEVLGYVVMTQKPCDKRENIIKITTTGQRIYLISKEKANELEAEITQGLESTELKSLSDYLERINAKINNQQEDEKGC
jgi:DNA-binding MarR family transcriptional regulator